MNLNAAKEGLGRSPYYVVFLDQTKDSKTTLVRVKDYSQEEFAEFVRARDLINDQILYYMDLYNMVAIMYDNLIKAYKKRIKAVESQRGVNARDDLTELNAYFAALIANFGMYLGCVPNKISSKRGELLAIHKKATNDEYDASFCL